eukprot:TRINITY_DN1476_c0_g1_i4.p2 TRINITY_DN1476_c0_g1~~TRINITY_DN1476_c0_g1_i4.p2  ORF type:complete len:153 (-),score=21.76 TRINITY_DN1476_c0_g1_i4:164-622(-)
MSEAQDKVQQEEKSEAKPPPMCVECHEFFGNAAMDNMCSVCYKNKKKTVQEAQPKEVKTSPEKKDDLNSSKMSIEENKDEEAEKKPKADPSRCFVCKKKVGLLGFQCKCQFTFCKDHRLPENHSCDFDFNTMEKERLKKANPTVKSSKLETV